MDYEIKDCIDSGTEYCPCPLAESHDCIICSHLQGSTFCDCKNWKGVCVYNTLKTNGNKAVKRRSTYEGTIVNKSIIGDNYIAIEVKVPHHLVEKLKDPGSFVFLRTKNSSVFFDAPISIIEADDEEDILYMALEIRGVKTKAIGKLEINDKLFVRGPYWNGVLGLKNIKNLKNEKAAIIFRGIGFACTTQVIKRMLANNNQLEVIIDPSDIKEEKILDYLKHFNVQIKSLNTMNDADLSGEVVEEIEDLIKNDIKLIYISGPDILISNIINKFGDVVKYGCSNNAKMCCGEGVCGACTARYDGRIIKKLCKVQVDPKYIFEGRWLL